LVRTTIEIDDLVTVVGVVCAAIASKKIETTGPIRK